jgi:hypothetical protein
MHGAPGAAPEYCSGMEAPAMREAVQIYGKDT